MSRDASRAPRRGEPMAGRPAVAARPIVARPPTATAGTEYAASAHAIVPLAHGVNTEDLIHGRNEWFNVSVRGCAMAPAVREAHAQDGCRMASEWRSKSFMINPHGSGSRSRSCSSSYWCAGSLCTGAVFRHAAAAS